MKKKLFNVTVGGYYICSIVLGIAMALTISMILCDVWDGEYEQYKFEERTVQQQYPDGKFFLEGIMYPSDDADTRVAWLALQKKRDSLMERRTYIPMVDLWSDMQVYSHYSDYSRNYGAFCLTAMAVITVILSVAIMEGKSANKAWRQKMLQAGGCSMLIIFLDLAFRYAIERSYGNMSTFVALVPVVLLVIPLFILKKTRQEKKGYVDQVYEAAKITTKSEA